ncbi:MAG: nitroreductase family protein [Hyphomicrobiaceae bacterium]
MLQNLATRRSVRPTMFQEPGPSEDQLHKILTVAARSPDHKKLNPWRFIVFEGEGRERVGEVFAQIFQEEDTETPSEIRLATERERFMRAPVVVALIASFVDKPAVPQWEQTLSTGAVGMNLCHAANALGYATCWLTEWMAYSPGVGSALGLSSSERVAGFIYIGTPTERQDDRPRPNIDDLVTRYAVKS